MKLIKGLLTILVYSFVSSTNGAAVADDRPSTRELQQQQSEWWGNQQANNNVGQNSQENEAQAFTLVELEGQTLGSVMAYRINRGDPRANGADTISLVYSVPAVAWAAVAFSRDGQMIGSEAVLANSETGEVLKYNLGGKAVNLVTPMPAEQQTLVEAAMTQDLNAGTTTFGFTKIMEEPNEIPIIIGQNTFLSAWGSSNTLGIHSNRQPYGIDLTTGTIGAPGGGGGEEEEEEEEEEDIDAADVVVDADGFQAINLEGQLEGATLQFVVNPNDPGAGGQDTITFIYTIPTAAWCAIGISDNGGFMLGSEAILATPDTGEVLKYNLNEKNVPGVVPMPENQQTLMDTSIVQEGGTTTLTFTKIMVEDGEIPINVGTNTFLGAWGSSNTLGVHAVRQSFAIDLQNVEAGVGELETRNQKMWKAHGLIAGITWGLLSPLAISASVLRKLFRGSAIWFQIHRGLNTLVVLCTIIAFSIAVAAINQETPEGASPNHFNPDPNPHRLTGLVIFIIAIVQALLGFFRPHLPHSEDEKKTTIRKIWEVVHRCLGFTCLGLAWYNVTSGIKIYQGIFVGSAEWAMPVFWAIAAGIGGGTLFGFISLKFWDCTNPECEKKKEQLEEEMAKQIDDDV